MGEKVGKEAEQKVYAAARAKKNKEKAVKYTKRRAIAQKKAEKEAKRNKDMAERWAEEKKAAADARKAEISGKHYMKIVIAREHAKKAKKKPAHPERSHKKSKFNSAAKKQLAAATAPFRSKDAVNTRAHKPTAKKAKKKLPHGAHTVKKPKMRQAPKKSTKKAKKKPIKLLGLVW